MLEKLYDFNHQTEIWKIKDYAPKPRMKKNLHEWGGGMARRELQAIYTIAFLCLLRSDEVLKIHREHVVYEGGTKPWYVLTLPFRKTHQDGSKFEG